MDLIMGLQKAVLAFSSDVWVWLGIGLLVVVALAVISREAALWFLKVGTLLDVIHRLEDRVIQLEQKLDSMQSTLGQQPPKQDLSSPPPSKVGSQKELFRLQF